MAWQKQTDRNSLRSDIAKDGITNWRDKAPPDNGNYLFTNLPKYNDLKPGEKVVEDALAQAGKK